MKAAIHLLIVGTLCLSVEVQAHHSMDLQEASPIQISGRIVLASWDGAHVVYRVEATNDEGQPVTWQVMGASPKILRGRGISKAHLPVGATVTVTGRFEPRTKVIAPNHFMTSTGARYDMGFYPPTLRKPSSDASLPTRSAVRQKIDE